ncbi:response regulator transcription factor [Malikia sp.]|uniref:response regulator transcription factor n=1 Tax=Malikia sp. TaxID=2070706 RepID=UPI002636C017|nr:response regulator transcription factor [Malikia sp.]MDD2730189.1 response regulator transcription factor [Malikia sp.]
MNEPVAIQEASASSPLIFVVEDDIGVAQLVVRMLESFQFQVRRFGDGGSVLHHVRAEHPALCIVDLGLPDMDGIELVRQIGQVSSCGVLILSGRDHPVDRVMGLELGGDDYITKPFDPRELVARVRSILRRRQPRNPVSEARQRRYARFLGWTWDCAANTLRDPEGVEHVLGNAESRVLKAFLERPHQILTREQLLGQRQLSPMDRSIDVRISRIRRKLEPDPQNPKIIKTVYGAGYMFTAAVTWS